MTWPCHRCAGAWALVPVKAPGDAKMRLSPVLSPDERAALQRAMLSDMLAALSRAASLAGVAVISPDRDVAAVAGRHGAAFIAERPATGDLNGAVAAGRSAIQAAPPSLIHH
jgi:2-phospho-L-lactate guanylyltransferase